jgi:hypothetical protein
MSCASLRDKSLPPSRERVCHRDRPDGVPWAQHLSKQNREGWQWRCMDRGNDVMGGVDPGENRAPRRRPPSRRPMKGHS